MDDQPIRTTSAKPTAATAAKSLFSVILGFGPHVGEVEILCSPTPPDPRGLPGWTIFETCTGWLAIRGRGE